MANAIKGAFSHGIPLNGNPDIKAIAAPKPAAEDTPKVYGLASGLESIVCICVPAKPNDAPTVRHISVIGSLIFQMIEASILSEEGPAKSAFSVSFKVIPEEPVMRSKSSIIIIATKEI